MVRDQVLVVTEKGESETDAGIVISASVRQRAAVVSISPALIVVGSDNARFLLYRTKDARSVKKHGLHTLTLG